jgi:hypothetical protein
VVVIIVIYIIELVTETTTDFKLASQNPIKKSKDTGGSALIKCRYVHSGRSITLTSSGSLTSLSADTLHKRKILEAIMKFSSICLLAVTASTASAFGVRQPTTQGALSTSLFAKPKIFIDGEAGTTGLQVRGRIEKRDDLEIISPPPELRKDDATRRKLINEADVVILCK